MVLLWIQSKIRIRATNCIFGVPSLTLLGHTIDKNGIKHLPEKVEAIVKIEVSVTFIQFRQFIGIANFYRRFIIHCAETLYSLDKLLRHRKKWTEKITFTPAEIQTLSDIKQKLADVSMLAPTISEKIWMCETAHRSLILGTK